MQTAKVTVTVTAAAPTLALTLTFNPVSGKPSATRGAWFDDVKLTAVKVPSGCVCNTP